MIRRQLRAVLLMVVCVGVALALGYVPSASAESVQVSASETELEKEIATELAQRINQLRVDNGIPIVDFYPDWSLAQQSAEMMAQNSQIDHFLSEDQVIDFYALNAPGPSTIKVSEIIGEAETPARAVSSFEASPVVTGLIDWDKQYMAVGAKCDGQGVFYVSVHMISYTAAPIGASAASSSTSVSGVIRDASGKYCSGTRHVPSGSSGSHAIANLEELEAGPGEIRIHGWSYDPDLPTFPVVVHVYAFYDGSDTPVALDTPVVRAGDFRPDVNRVLDIDGNHGFNRTLAIRPGSHRVCAYSLSVDAVGELDDLNELIGCEDVTIHSDSAPRGVIDFVARDVSSLFFRGWAYDLDDEWFNVTIDVEVDGVYVDSTVAYLMRPDVNKILDVDGNHGFDAGIVFKLTEAFGPHEVCWYANGFNPDGGPDRVLLECRNV